MSYQTTSLLAFQTVPHFKHARSIAVDAFDKTAITKASPDELALRLDIATARLTTGDVNAFTDQLNAVSQVPHAAYTESIRQRILRLCIRFPDGPFPGVRDHAALISKLVHRTERQAQLMAETFDAVTNGDNLSSRAYRTGRDLTKRRDLYQYQTPQYDIPSLIIDVIGGQEPTQILDVGCGQGETTKRLRTEFPDTEVVGLDISEGIMADLEAPTVVGDAQDLRWESDTFDVVLAIHMIYHLEEIDRGIREMARVLTPGGQFIASTNAANDKKELDELWRAAASTILDVKAAPGRVKLSTRFDLDSAPQIMGQYFTEVNVHELTGVIEVDDPAPVISHFESYRSFADSRDLPFDSIVKEIGRKLNERIARDGVFRIACRNGLVTGQTPKR